MEVYEEGKDTGHATQASFANICTFAEESHWAAPVQQHFVNHQLSKPLHEGNLRRLQAVHVVPKYQRF